jgi:hypothetical protein
MSQLITTHIAWVFSLLAVLGALLHYANKVRKGEVPADFVGYWVQDYPGTSIATVLVLAGAIVTAITTGMLEGMQPAAVVMAGLMTGWTLDSAINKGAPK